ncbi:MAG TPA: polysaccharide biosynthesis/export family protein [Acidobacteriaceae bacterium]|jgi:polysaccharide export outer membrane protein|nr:polysaccharide biosynthesis/export family protein [Acidobacteriaceae bacterium]
MKSRLYSCIALVVLLSAGSRIVVAQADAGDPPAEATTAAPHNDTFVIGNDDKLNINVWKDTELTKTVQVRPDGMISMPLVGELQAAGRTPLQLENAIADKLKAYISQPDVTVIVEQINSQKFNILGKVAKPGSYPLTTTTTILDAIAEAGGFLDFAKQKDVYILRPKPEGGEARLHFNYKDVIKGKHTEENVRLEPRDTIVVP